MNRCDHFDREYVGTPPDMRVKRHRCPDEGVWVWRGGWYCDGHARQRWDGDLTERLFKPRDRADSRDPEARVPGWVPASLRDLADRLDRRVAVPAVRSLFEETT